MNSKKGKHKKYGHAARNTDERTNGMKLRELNNKIDLMEVLKNSDWPEKPWFLQAEHRDGIQKWFVNYSDIDFDVSARQLQRLFTRSVCEKLVEDKQQPIVGPLIVPGDYLHIQPIIFLGKNLKDADPWESEKDIIGRLRKLHEFSGANLELEVIAALRRSDIHVAFQPQEKDKRRADLLIEWRGKKYVVELKIMKESDANRFIWCFEEEMSFKAIPFDYPSGISVIMKDKYNRQVLLPDGRKLLDKNRSEIIATIAKEFKTWAENGYIPEYLVGAYTIFKKSASQRMSLEIGFNASTSPRRTAELLARSRKQRNKFRQKVLGLF